MDNNIVKDPALKYNYLSPKEYLELERSSGIKHELHDGILITMQGASKNHGRIVRNLLRTIDSFLEDTPCEVFSTDLKVYNPVSNTFTYPDLVVICGRAEDLDEHQDVVTNPSIIIEVLSPATEVYDRGSKFLMSQQITSLREYVTIQSTSIEITVNTRQIHGNWTHETSRDTNSSLILGALNIQVPLSGIYKNVKF